MGLSWYGSNSKWLEQESDDENTGACIISRHSFGSWPTLIGALDDGFIISDIITQLHRRLFLFQSMKIIVASRIKPAAAAATYDDNVLDCALQLRFSHCADSYAHHHHHHQSSSHTITIDKTNSRHSSALYSETCGTRDKRSRDSRDHRRRQIHTMLGVDRYLEFRHGWKAPPASCRIHHWHATNTWLRSCIGSKDAPCGDTFYSEMST
jgi:hypothetical protein